MLHHYIADANGASVTLVTRCGYLINRMGVELTPGQKWPVQKPREKKRIFSDLFLKKLILDIYFCPF